MRKTLVFIFLYLACVLAASAQTQFPAYSVWGNPTGSTALPQATKAPVVGTSLGVVATGAIYNSSTSRGVWMTNSGIQAASNGIVAFFNRNNTPGAGTIVDFRYDGTNVGAVTTDATGIGFNSVGDLTITTGGKTTFDTPVVIGDTDPQTFMLRVVDAAAAGARLTTAQISTTTATSGAPSEFDTALHLNLVQSANASQTFATHVLNITADSYNLANAELAGIYISVDHFDAPGTAGTNYNYLIDSNINVPNPENRPNAFGMEVVVSDNSTPVANTVIGGWRLAITAGTVDKVLQIIGGAGNITNIIDYEDAPSQPTKVISGGSYTASYDAAAHIFEIGGTEAFRVDASGNGNFQNQIIGGGDVNINSGNFTVTASNGNVFSAGTLEGNALALNGSTSGQMVVVPAATVGGTFTITLPKGSTDFSTTGGTSQVLKQTSAGGAITVAQLAASDLSNGTTGSGSAVLATDPTFANDITVTNDILLGSGSVLNFNSGDVTVTHSAGTLTFDGGNYSLTGGNVGLDGANDYALQLYASGNNDWLLKFDSAAPFTTTSVTGAGLYMVAGSAANQGFAFGRSGGVSVVEFNTNTLGAYFRGAVSTADLVLTADVASAGADTIALGVTDLSVGNTIPVIRTEGGGIYSAGTPAASTGSIAMEVDGTVYYFTVSTTPAS